MRIHALLFLLLFAVPLAGCGGTSEEPDDPSSEVTSETMRDDGAEDTVASGGDDASGETEDSEPGSDDRVLPDPTEADMEEEDTPELVASVNGEPLTMAEFQRQTFDAQRYFVEQGLDPSTEEGQADLMALRRTVLLDMINQELMRQAADEMGIEASDEEVEERLANFDDALEESMAAAGVTREDVREMERQSVIGLKFVDRIAADVPSRATFYRARHILCEDRGTCEAALSRLEAGEPFEDVAAELSVDDTTAERGGDLDWIPRVEGVSTLPSSELEESIFSLEPGERSAVVESAFGYHVVELVETEPERELEDDQIFDLRQRRVTEWLAERLDESDVVIYLDDLKDAIAQR